MVVGRLCIGKTVLYGTWVWYRQNAFIATQAVEGPLN